MFLSKEIQFCYMAATLLLLPFDAHTLNTCICWLASNTVTESSVCFNPFNCVCIQKSIDKQKSSQLWLICYSSFAWSKIHEQVIEEHRKDTKQRLLNSEFYSNNNLYSCSTRVLARMSRPWLQWSVFVQLLQHFLGSSVSTSFNNLSEDISSMYTHYVLTKS